MNIISDYADGVPCCMSASPLKSGSPNSRGYVNFTPKFIIVGAERLSIFLCCNLVLLVTEGGMQNFRTLEQSIL